MHITDHLFRQAQTQPTKTSFIFDDKTYTWAELADEVEQYSRYLGPKLDTTEQQIVGILLHNSWQFLIAYLAVLHTGHIALPFDPNHKKLESAAKDQ